MMLRLLWQYVFGRSTETECASKSNNQDGGKVCPVGRTALSKSEVFDGGRFHGRRLFRPKKHDIKDQPEPEKLLEKTSGGESIPMGECPVCKLGIQIYTPCCPNCGTKFFRGRQILK